jgi:hypothetical protein
VNLKIKGKMLIILLIPMVVVLASLGLYNYHAAKVAMNQQILETATYCTGDYAGQINAALIIRRRLLEI